jgi:hypothetical protein
MRQTLYIKWVSHIGRGASAASVFIVGAILFSGSLLVGGTLLYAREGDPVIERDRGDVVAERERRISEVMASNVNFFLETDSTIVYFGGGDATSTPRGVLLTSVPDPETPPVLYNFTAEYLSGDTTLCDAIQFSSPLINYEGKLNALDGYVLVSESSSWMLLFTLEEGYELLQDTECSMTIHVVGWDSTKTKHQKKYRDEENVHIIFSSKSADTSGPITILIETIGATLTDLFSEEKSFEGSTTTSEKESNTVDQKDTAVATSSENVPALESDGVINSATSTEPTPPEEEGVVHEETIVEEGLDPTPTSTEPLPTEGETGSVVVETELEQEAPLP